MRKLYPTDCVINTCNKIVYVEKHQLGLGLECDSCLEKRQNRTYDDEITLKELDCVTLKTAQDNLPKSSKGTIVFDYGREGMFEVEFFNDKGETICVTRIHKNDLELRK